MKKIKELKNIKIKEFQRTILLVDIIMYLLITFVGYSIVNVLYNIDDNMYALAETVFFLLAFIFILAYVINRRKNDYEYLINGFIGVYTSLYLCMNESNTNTSSFLGTAVLIFSFSYLVNKLYNGYRLYKDKDINFISKTAIGIVLGVLGIYLSTLIYNIPVYSSYIFGYYFIIFGLYSLLEPLIAFLLRDPLISNKAYMLLKYENKNSKKTTKTQRKVRETKTKRISKKSSK